MVLAVQGIVRGEEALCGLLETQQVGTEVLHVLLLNQRLSRCHAEVGSASLDDLKRWLHEGYSSHGVCRDGSTPLLAHGVSACLGRRWHCRTSGSSPCPGFYAGAYH